MLPKLLLCSSLIPLGVMIVSDFRTRRIGIGWLCLSFLLLWIGAWSYHGEIMVAVCLKYNLAFLILLYCMLGLYIYILRRRAFSSFFRAIGLGDLLFLPALTPLFETRDFILFLTVSFSLTLSGWGILRLLGRAPRTVPLVGTVGLCFVFVTLIRIFQ